MEAKGNAGYEHRKIYERRGQMLSPKEEADKKVEKKSIEKLESKMNEVELINEVSGKEIRELRTNIKELKQHISYLENQLMNQYKEFDERLLTQARITDRIQGNERYLNI